MRKFPKKTCFRKSFKQQKSVLNYCLDGCYCVRECRQGRAKYAICPKRKGIWESDTGSRV